jgi:predicted nucleic acid-binding protein
MLIYCDSMILIYYLDHFGPWQVRASSRLAALRRAGDQLVISDLSRLECRVGPIRRRDNLTLAKLDAFFALADVVQAPLTAVVFDRATEIRAAHGFRTADAIHLAAAIVQGCGAFLTNDARLSKVTGMSVEQLP